MWLTYQVTPEAIDKERVGVLPLVVSSETRKVLVAVQMEPVRDQHHVRRQVVVVQLAVRVIRSRFADHQVPYQTVHLLQTCCQMNPNFESQFVKH